MSWPRWFAREPDPDERRAMAGHGLDEPDFSPECAWSRHQSCTGWAWDAVSGGACACECSCHGRATA